MTTKQTKASLKAIQKAIDLLGGLRPAGRATGYTQNAMYKVYHGMNVNPVSADLVVKLSKAVKGKVKKHEMRPDLFRSHKKKAA